MDASTAIKLLTGLDAPLSTLIALLVAWVVWRRHCAVQDASNDRIDAIVTQCVAALQDASRTTDSAVAAMERIAGRLRADADRAGQD